MFVVPVAGHDRVVTDLDPADPAQGRAEIEGALADRPLDAAALGVTARCALVPGDGGGAITAEITGAGGRFGRGTTAVIEADARSDLVARLAGDQTDQPV